MITSVQSGSFPPPELRSGHQHQHLTASPQLTFQQHEDSHQTIQPQQISSLTNRPQHDTQMKLNVWKHWWPDVSTWPEYPMSRITHIQIHWLVWHFVLNMITATDQLTSQRLRKRAELFWYRAWKENVETVNSSMFEKTVDWCLIQSVKSQDSNTSFQNYLYPQLV